MPTHTRLTQDALRHQIYLERLKTGHVREFLTVFNRSNTAIRNLLIGAGVNKLNELTRPAFNKLLRELQLKQGELFSAAVDNFLGQMPALALYEAQHEVRTLQNVAKKATQKQLAIPSAKQLEKEVLARPVQAFGKRLSDLTKDWSDSAIDLANGSIRNAYEQGKTVAEVVRDIVGSERLQYRDGKGAISKRAAATVVRTGVQQVATTARTVTYEENSDLVRGYLWVSTLDSKTTIQCQALDGQHFKIGDGPMPPIHPNCRSTTTPDLGPEFDFLDKGATRSSKDGYVDANTTYYDFLKNQDPEFQDGVLGATRGQLFREGGLSVERFRDLQLDRNFEPMTLAEMRRIEPKAFERAGIRGVPKPRDPASPSAPKVKPEPTPPPIPTPPPPVEIPVPPNAGIDSLSKPFVPGKGELGKQGVEGFKTEKDFHDFFKMSPGQLKEHLLNSVGQSSDAFTMLVKREGESLHFALVGKNAALTDFQMERNLVLKHKTAHHDLFQLPKEMQNKDVAKQVLKNQLELYDHLGITKIQLNANIDVGGYAWARYGFTPTEMSWQELREGIRVTTLDSVLESLPAEVLAEVNSILASEEPSAIRRLAALKYPVKGTTLGKKLLLGTSWDAEIDLANPESYGILKAYINAR